MTGSNRLVREVDDAEGVDKASDRAVSQHPADSADDSGEVPFVPLAEPLGLRTGFDTAHLGALADDLEVDAFLKLSRRLIDRNPCG